MARLLVEACTAEGPGGDIGLRVVVGVSVSRVSDGTPVTGLTAANFRVASFIGSVKDFGVSGPYERKWEPGDTEPSGCYQLEIYMTDGNGGNLEPFIQGARYVFGIQARTFAGRKEVVDQGQTIVEVISFGN